MATNYYISGDWNLTCDVCSKKVKASISKKRWDGFQVCPDCWEERQPLDFIRARIDKITVPFQRPIPAAEYIFSCDLAARYGAADWGSADCAIADFVFDYSEACTIVERSGMAGVGIAGCMLAGGSNGYF
jgi:hypothetical protein